MNIKLSSLNKGLVAHWTMSQDSLKGSLLADKTPYSNDGTIYGATFATDRMGQPNKAMSFDGVDDYIDCGGGDYFKNQNFTISFWASAHEIESGPSGVIGTTGYYPKKGIGLYSNVNNKYNIWIGNGTTMQYVSKCFTITIGWNYYVVTKNGVDFKIYKNGILVKEDSTSLTINYEGVSFLIGRSVSANYDFFGLIDDVRIYNRALSEEEIKTLYNSYNPNIKMKTSLPKIKLYARYGNK